MTYRKRIFIYAVALCQCICSKILFAGPINNVARPQLVNPTLVEKFYALNQGKLSWFTSPSSLAETERYFVQLLDSSIYLGLNKNKYHYSELNDGVSKYDTSVRMRLDKIFLDAIITYCKDLYQGDDILRWVQNDEISRKFMKSDDSFLLSRIVAAGSIPELNAVLNAIEPSTTEYTILKEELRKQIQMGNHRKSEEVISAINLYRWVHHFNFEEYILVNIPSATLFYYEREEMKLQMKVVAGKPATKSPRFSSWCNEVILYPFWNVPRNIGLKELLPVFKRSPESLEKMNMQVIGSNGKAIDRHSINWAKYNRSNFPYRFRQCTGCENSLGVIKFNLTDPFDVYLHDTNFKIAFLKDTRFLSHGCIRIEQPIELANYLLDDKLDSNFLKACYKNMEPKTIKLAAPVPVFVVYLPVEVIADKIRYNKDIYHLFK